MGWLGARRDGEGRGHALGKLQQLARERFERLMPQPRLRRHCRLRRGERQAGERAQLRGRAGGEAPQA